MDPCHVAPYKSGRRGCVFLPGWQGRSASEPVESTRGLDRFWCTATLVASRRAAPATQRDRCGSPRCVDRRHTEPSAGRSDAAQRRIDAESPAGQFAGTGRAYRPHSGQGVQGCARVCKGVQGVQLHSMASTIIAEQCKMRAIGFRVDWACHRPEWVCSIRSI